MIKRILIYTFLLIAVLFVTGCNSNEDTPAGTPNDNQNTNSENLDNVNASVNMNVGETYTIPVEFNITITSTDPTVAAVDSASKTISALQEGLVIVKVTLNSDNNISKEIIVSISKSSSSNEGKETDPITVEITNPIKNLYLDDEYQIETKVYPESASQDVIFKTNNKSVIGIDEDGTLHIVSSGEATISVFSKKDASISATLTIKIEQTINPDNFIKSLAISNPVYQSIQVTGFQRVYTHQLTGSISNYLFEDLNIIEQLIPESNGNRPGTSSNGNKFKAYYVTFHDTANANTGAKGHASYWAGSNVDSSVHFTTGNDGIYQLLPYGEVGYHAGDGTATALTFTDTKIKAPAYSNEPAKVTISSDGYYLLNGEKSTISVPRNSSGGIPTNSQLPYTGINNYVDKVTGTYWIGSTYWNTDYRIVSNRGGNLNSIGIESCIDEGSNLFYTWALSAKLIGEDILIKCGLDVGDVKQHNTFSGKDCPMTMRDANRWETFIALCTAEYNKAYYFSDWTITLNCDSEYIDSNGLIKSLPSVETKINYSITFTNNKDYNKTFDFTATLPKAK